MHVMYAAPLLAAAAPVHTGTTVTVLVTALGTTGLVIIGLVMRPQGRTLPVFSWVSVGLVATCAMNAALVSLGGT